MAKTENKETFETALLKLETIIKDLESGEIDLDNSIEKYNEAMKLVKFCTEKLETASKTVNKILNEDGEFVEFKRDDME